MFNERGQEMIKKHLDKFRDKQIEAERIIELAKEEIIYIKDIGLNCKITETRLRHRNMYEEFTKEHKFFSFPQERTLNEQMADAFSLIRFLKTNYVKKTA